MKYIDTSQNYGRGGRSETTIPTLISRTTLVMVEKERTLLGYEAFMVHGYPMSQVRSCCPAVSAETHIA